MQGSRLRRSLSGGGLSQAAAASIAAAAILAGCGSGGSATGSSQEHTGNGVPARPAGPITTGSGVRAAKRPEPEVTPPEGPPPRRLIVEDLIKGTGRAAHEGDQLAVHFVSIRFDGEFFESIWKKPFEFELSHKDVNPGWVQGLPGMRVGGRRELVVPIEMTSRFPIQPSEDDPENALVYVVDLLDVH